ncbi:hypothetical protein VNO80_30204 [Phaseolus coccineus]|uniref:Uncharacterized protein n=1 Tax=Phaseolus coccineus TaxID=3886 RepID=A0AAN9LCF4_PHACN
MWSLLLRTSFLQKVGYLHDSLVRLSNKQPACSSLKQHFCERNGYILVVNFMANKDSIGGDRKQHREISASEFRGISFSLIGIWKGTTRHGFPGDDADLHSDRNHRKPLHQNLLQQRTFYQSISPNFSNYCNNLLLDDVGDCISGTDEATHCTYIE